MINRILALFGAVVMSLMVLGAAPASAHPSPKNSQHEVVVHRAGLPDGCSVSPRWGQDKLGATGIVTVHATCNKASGWVPRTMMIRKTEICAHVASGSIPCAKWLPWKNFGKRSIHMSDSVRNEAWSARFPLLPGIYQIRQNTQVSFGGANGEGKNSVHQVAHRQVFRGMTINPLRN